MKTRETSVRLTCNCISSFLTGSTSFVYYQTNSGQDLYVSPSLNSLQNGQESEGVLVERKCYLGLWGEFIPVAVVIDGEKIPVTTV